MSPDFSIVIITRNRASIIGNVLESLSKLNTGNICFELVLVDNGSTDGTSNVAKRILEYSSIIFKIIVEPVKGICRARNTGYQNSSAKWIIYLDDDALVPPDWLVNYDAAINTFPNAVAFGGPAALDKNIHRPWWWISEFDKTMSCQDYGSEYFEYPSGTNPYGLNMMIKRSILVEQGGFDERLDTWTRSFADETELFLRIRKQRGKIIYVPSVRVIHSVQHSRLKWRNFTKRFFLVGKSHACLDYLHGTNHKRPLHRRLLSAFVLFLKYRTPAYFFTEVYDWCGYNSFRAE